MVAQRFVLRRGHRNFVKDVATLVTGKVAAFLLTFLSTPIISRLFDPGDYGTAALFTSLASVAATVATLSWERAAVVAKNDVDGLRLCRLALYSLAACCVLLWVIALVAVALRLDLPFADQLGAWTWALPIGVLLLGLTQIGDGYLTRAKNYKRMALSDFSQAAVISGSRIASGLAFGSSVWGVITGDLLGLMAELAVKFSGIKPWALAGHRREDAPALRTLATEYKEFPLYSAPAGFVRMFSQELPTMMFSLMFSATAVGFYAMASRLARLPLRLAAAALQRVLLQRLAEVVNEGRPITPAYTRITVALAGIALPPFALLWFAGETILALFLGPKWEPAGHYVVILVPWLYTLWISTPATTVMTVLRRQAIVLRVQIMLAIARLAVFGVAYVLAATPEATLHAFVAVSAISSFAGVFITYGIARRADRARSTPITQ